MNALRSVFAWWCVLGAARSSKHRRLLTRALAAHLLMSGAMRKVTR